MKTQNFFWTIVSICEDNGTSQNDRSTLAAFSVSSNQYRSFITSEYPWRWSHLIKFLCLFGTLKIFV